METFEEIKNSLINELFLTSNYNIWLTEELAEIKNFYELYEWVTQSNYYNILNIYIPELEHVEKLNNIFSKFLPKTKKYIVASLISGDIKDKQEIKKWLEQNFMEIVNDQIINNYIQECKINWLEDQL